MFCSISESSKKSIHRRKTIQKELLLRWSICVFAHFKIVIYFQDYIENKYSISYIFFSCNVKPQGEVCVFRYVLTRFYFKIESGKTSKFRSLRIGDNRLFIFPIFRFSLGNKNVIYYPVIYNWDMQIYKYCYSHCFLLFSVISIQFKNDKSLALSMLLFVILRNDCFTSAHIPF